MNQRVLKHRANKAQTKKWQSAGQKGITLIALVITIIVLLILAGVAISQITGNSSILQKAQNASDETLKAEELSQVQLAVAKVRANNVAGLGEVTNENNELADALNGIATITETNADNWKVQGAKTNGIYTIYKNGKVEAPAGTPVASTTPTPTEEPTPATVALTGITLTKNPDSNSIVVGNYVDITATLSPDNTTDTGVTFEITETSEEGVVTLSNTTDLSTRVTGAKAGTATITVTGAQTTGVSTTYQVTVTDNISVTASASRSAGSISSTYTWTQLADFAKIISNNSSTITNNTEKVTITKNGTTYGVLVVGDTTTVTFDGSSKGVRILGFNHDELTSKTAASSPYSDGVAHTYAGISFEFTENIGTSKMNSSGTNSGGWASCALKTGTASSTIKGLDAYYLPKININSSIKYVKKKYNPTYSATGTATTTTDDKLWLLSCSEIWNNGYSSSYNYGYTKAKEGEQYKYYKLKNPEASESTNTYLVKSYSSWWLRSPYFDRSSYFCSVYSSRSSGRHLCFRFSWRGSWLFNLRIELG